MADPVLRGTAAGTAETSGGLGIGGALIALWLVGTGVLLVRLGFGVVSAWWTARTATPLVGDDWSALLQRLADDLGIVRPVRLLESASVSTPMAWGIFRSSVLLPDDAHAWSGDRRRAVLLHELGHVKRRDCLVHLLAQAARAVHWLNPLAWIGTRRLHAERERACDDLVLSAGTRGSDYARLLLDVARGRRGGARTFAAVSMARPSELEGRLLAVLDSTRDRRGITRVAALVWALAAIAIVLPLAALRAVPVQAVADATDPPVARMADVPSPRPRARARATARATDVSRSVTGAPQATPETDADPSGLPRVLDASTTETAARLGLLEHAPGLADGFAVRADTLDERVLQAFVRALGSERAGLREQAAHALGMAESARAVDPLSRALIQDESAAVRSEAAWALGMIESADAVDALTRAVRDEDAGVRSQVAWALGMIEAREGVDGLATALRDESASVRSQAAWALGMIEDARATEPLMRTLASDESAEVRSQAAWALGMIQDDRAMDVLIDALEDEDDGVAEQAMWALGRVMN